MVILDSKQALNSESTEISLTAFHVLYFNKSFRDYTILENLEYKLYFSRTLSLVFFLKKSNTVYKTQPIVFKKNSMVILTVAVNKGNVVIDINGKKLHEYREKTVAIEISSPPKIIHGQPSRNNIDKSCQKAVKGRKKYREILPPPNSKIQSKKAEEKMYKDLLCDLRFLYRAYISYKGF